MKPLAHIIRRAGPSLLITIFLLACEAPTRAAEASKPLEPRDVIQQLETLIQREIDEGRITGLSIALIDDQTVIYSRGFGVADRKGKTPVTRDTIFRTGSVSKLFTAVAAMQLAEAGKLDIDRPIAAIDPRFSIVNPFEGSKQITARQLMCHRSGMIRESPVGSYFDDSRPGMEATVRSLRDCALVNPPDTKTRYSNVGPTIVGLTIEKISGLDFEGYQQKHLLGPLAMKSSSFLMNDKLRPRLSKAYMPVADGKGGFREIEAPAFDLGTLPAGNLYSTADDLAQFAKCLLAEGAIARGDAPFAQLIKPATLKEMFTIQLTKEEKGFGLGFSIGQFGKHRTASHMGAVFGFTTAFTLIPQQKLAVVVLNNDDINIGPVRKINNTALALLLKAKLGEEPAAPAKPLALSREALARFTGDYESESYWASIRFNGDALEADISGQRNSLTPVGELKFDAYGRQLFDQAFDFQKDEAGAIIGFTAAGQKYTRVDPAKVAPIPKEWRVFLGSYGPDFIPLIVTQRHGHLYAMTENLYDYRLTPLNRTVFKMCPGMYTDEQLVFELDSGGKPHGIIMSNVRMKRR